MAETEKEPLVPEEDNSQLTSSGDKQSKTLTSERTSPPKPLPELQPTPGRLQQLFGLRHKVTGSCLCKLSVVFYLLVCVAVSVLYVGIYGYQHETDLEDQPLPWIPGTPPAVYHEKPKTTIHFQDLPYTEWIAKRWTYSNESFSDWPTLPNTITNITQIAQGTISKSAGFWLLTNTELYFVRNLDGLSSNVEFLNVSETIELDITAGSMVAVDTGSKVYVVTPENITLLDCSGDYEDYCDIVTTNSEPLPFNSVHSTSISLSTGALWLGTDHGLFSAVTLLPTPFSVMDEQYFDGDIVITNVTDVEGDVTTLLWRSPVSSGGHSSAFILTPGARNVRQTSMASSTSQGSKVIGAYNRYDVFGLLVVGTTDRLYFYDGRDWWFEWVSVWYNGLGGVIDGTPTSLAVGGAGEIYVSNNISMTRININYTFDRIGPLQGLPYNQIMSLCYIDYTVKYPHPTKGFKGHLGNPGALWVGTSKGYVLFDTDSSKFKGYFYGPRWHSGEEIKAITGTGGVGVVLLTDMGLTLVTPEEWTLARKANHYQQMLTRHTREPGLVADCPLTSYTPSTCTPYTTDNDGLWTSWLVAAEAFRYQVTKDKGAKENAWSLFNGLAFLVNATGVRGLMARSVLTENSTVPGGVWHNSSTTPGWLWKGDTSSDEVVGHMFAYPIVYDLVAEEDGEKMAVQELVDDIVGYIKDNGYYLIDVTNKSTTWGVWAPSQLNLNVSWADEHGLNSLQILSYLLSAYRITKKTEYLDAWRELSQYEHYGLNMINQKITFPRDDNFSDDELAFLPYFTYFQSLKMMNTPIDAQARYYGNLSLERAWQVVGREKSSAWTAIYGYARGLPKDPSLIEQLVWNLRTWPLELVQWKTANSHRLDIHTNPEQDRNMHSGSQSVDVLAANERSQLRWNGNPYLLDYGGQDNEMDPGAWLMPYWLARWTGML